jgi:protein-tyrosine-phosphatase
MNQPKNIIIVCVGNKCRSVAGEEYMHQKLIERGYANIELSSAGVATGVSFDRPTRQFTQDLGNKADLLIAMDESVAYSLSNSFDQPKAKITALHILDTYDQDPEGLVRDLDKQLLPLINKYFPKKE